MGQVSWCVWGCSSSSSCSDGSGELMCVRV